MSITIDVREKKLIEVLTEKGIAFTTKALDLGDIYVQCGDKEILIERKREDDYFSSLSDGRFEEQRQRYYAWRNEDLVNRDVIYIFEKMGTGCNPFPFSGVTTKKPDDILHGGKVSLMIKFRFIIFEARNMSDIVEFLEKMLLKVGENPVRKVTYFKKKSDSISPDNFWTHALSLIPGLSMKRAELILQKYTFKNLVEGQDVSQLVDGKRKIGKKLSEKIQEYLKNYLP